MEMSYKFDKKWELFFELRYTMLGAYYPHKTFGVEQGTFEFFQITLTYLEGRKELPKREVGNIYTSNYIDWLVEWKNQINA